MAGGGGQGSTVAHLDVCPSSGHQASQFNYRGHKGPSQASTCRSPAASEQTSVPLTEWTLASRSRRAVDSESELRPARWPGSRASQVPGSSSEAACWGAQPGRRRWGASTDGHVYRSREGSFVKHGVGLSGIFNQLLPRRAASPGHLKHPLVRCLWLSDAHSDAQAGGALTLLRGAREGGEDGHALPW